MRLVDFCKKYFVNIHLCLFLIIQLSLQISLILNDMTHRKKQG